MVFESVDRRSYLGGVVAAASGLAGCNFLSGSDSPESRQVEDGEATQQSIPKHSHGSASSGGASLSPQDVNGDVYAARMPGDDLSTKVRNAIDALPAGQGTVIVTPNPDGGPWLWRETLSVNLQDTGAITLRFRGMTMIEYTGDSWAIETTYRPAKYGQLSEGTFFNLHGGNWRATGNPDGWLRMIDTNFSEIRPQRVFDFTNDDLTATAIRVEIQKIFSESNVFTGHIANCDIGMDFVPSDQEGVHGGTAASFQGNYIQNLKVLNASRYGFRWRDGAQCQALQAIGTEAFAGLETADETVLYYLGGDFDGAVFVGPKTEDAGHDTDEYDANDVAYRIPDAMGTPPILIAPNYGDGHETLVDRDDRFKMLPTLKNWDDGRRVRAGVHDLGRHDEEGYFSHAGVVFPEKELYGEYPILPRREGKVVYFSGDGDGVQEGLYRADPGNDRWVKVEDNSVTISR